MTLLVRARLLVAGLVALVACLPVRSAAQPRTDVVTLRNGDRITGEIKKLERGKLEFKTDDAGTLSIEWDNVRHLAAARLFEVGTSDGLRFLGSFGPAPDGSLGVVAGTGTITLPMVVVTVIVPIGSSLWRKLDGSIDVGFSYTKSSGIAQLNVNADTIYRRPKFESRLSVASTLTKQENGTRDDRGSIDFAYVRYRWPRWFVSAGGRFETNESLGLRLRSQVAGAVGPRLVNTNRAQLILGGGVVLNDERGVGAEPTQNVEALVLFRTSYYTYDQPNTDLDVSFQYYPSLSDTGRHRLQFDAAVRRELWKNFFVAVNGFDSFDSRPPNPDFDRNDVGVVLSVGWSY